MIKKTRVAPRNGLIAALVAVGLIAALTALGKSLSAIFTHVSTTLNTASS